MGFRNVKFKPGDYIKKCPECGNNTEFVVRSEQVCEDGCEIWARCKCGHNPSEEVSGSRIEDVWGALDDGNCQDAIVYTWNELIDEAKQKIK